MLRENEVFSFDLKMLSKDTIEQNFEMIHADNWQNRQRCAHDLAFDALVSRVTKPYEVCFEMIHMVHYVSGRIHRTIFEAWDPPYMFAEFWIQKQSQFAVMASKHGDKRPENSRPRQRHQSTQVDLTEPVGPQSASAKLDEVLTKKNLALNVQHRAIPGFRSILQCGANTVYGDATFLGTTTNTAVTPTTARVNRLFQESTIGFAQYSVPESPGHTQTTGSPSISMEDSSVAKRIQRMFQEISEGEKKSFRSEGVENEPPFLMEVSEKHIQQNAESFGKVLPRSAASKNLEENCYTATQHGEKCHDDPDIPCVGDEPQISSHFSIFYDPLGLETNVQIPVTTESLIPPANESHSSVHYGAVPVIVQSSSSQARATSRSGEAQSSLRDPRLRAKQALPTATVASDSVLQPGSTLSGTALFDWFEDNRSIATEHDESVVAARSSLAFNSPTTFFSRIMSRRTGYLAK